jgi:hypothetical protein
VEEVCTVSDSEPLVKVLCLVEMKNIAMGYLYEAMAKEAICTFYEDKGDEGHEK